MSKYVLCLGAGWQQLETILSLVNAGYKVIAVDGDKNAPGFRFSTKSISFDIKNAYLISRHIIEKKYKLLCVIAPINDVGQKSGFEIAEFFSIPGPSISASIYSNSKAAIKLRLSSLYATSSYQLVNQATEFASVINFFINEGRYIIKPSASSGSRGITVIDFDGCNQINFDFAKKKALNFSADGFAILEKYIDGEEYSIETFSMLLGGHRTVLVSLRTVNGVSANQIVSLPIESEVFIRLSEFSKKILDKLNYLQGPSHMEVKISKKGDIYLMDIGLRGGGYWVADRMVARTIGVNLGLLHVREMLGEKLNLNFDNKKNKMLFYTTNKKDISHHGEFKKDRFALVDRMEFNKNSGFSLLGTDSERESVEYWEGI